MRDELGTSRVAGIDADLDLLFAQLKALRELAADPEKSHDSARIYDFSIRWGTLIHGRLERLAYYHDRAALTPDEQTRYQTLRSELRGALPLIDQLGLVRPQAAFN